MSKGEIPKIPEYLQESVRSTEAYEQDARRDFQISDYARKRQIPESSMQTNETVRRYVTVLLDAAERVILEEGFQAHMAGGVDLPVRPIDIDPGCGDSITRRLDRVAQP